MSELMDTVREPEPSPRRLLAYFEGAEKIIIALGVLGGALFWLVDTRFETKASAAACKERTEERIYKVEAAIIGMSKDVVYIKEGVDEIKRRNP